MCSTSPKNAEISQLFFFLSPHLLPQLAADERPAVSANYLRPRRVHSPKCHNRDLSENADRFGAVCFTYLRLLRRLNRDERHHTSFFRHADNVDQLEVHAASFNVFNQLLLEDISTGPCLIYRLAAGIAQRPTCNRGGERTDRHNSCHGVAQRGARGR